MLPILLKTRIILFLLTNNKRGEYFTKLWGYKYNPIGEKNAIGFSQVSHVGIGKIQSWTADICFKYASVTD